MAPISKLGTVVIGGGTGFIGKALSNLLKGQGYDIIVISRKPGPFSMTWGELKSEGLPSQTVAVVNLAGQNILDPTRRWTTGFKQNVYASRINTTKYLVDAIQVAERKPKVFVTTSGVGFYKPSPSEEYDESSTGGNFDFLSRLCTDWEAAAQLPSELNIRTVTIRCGVVLGRNGGMIQQLFIPFYFGLGGPIGSGNQFLPWIHIHDATHLFMHAIENESLNGIVNGVAPHIVTNAEFSKAFGSALWRPAVIPVPEFVLHLLFSAERAKIMTEGQRVLPKKALDSGFTFKYPDIHLAVKEFSKLFYSEQNAIEK